MNKTFEPIWAPLVTYLCILSFRISPGWNFRLETGSYLQKNAVNQTLIHVEPDKI